MRTCTKCGQPKAETDYYVRKTPRHGSTLHRECKACQRARRSRNYWSEKRLEILAKGKVYRDERRKRVRDAVFAAYGGYRCACCGETERLFLTIDHIANDGAEFRRAQFGGQHRGAGMLTYLWLAQHGFPPGLQVLCANCQFGKRMNAGICPHQTRCNDQTKVVGSSDPKRSASVLRLVTDEDMVSSADESRSSRKADVA
jgi:hypothetical protein